MILPRLVEFFLSASHRQRFKFLLIGLLPLLFAGAAIAQQPGHELYIPSMGSGGEILPVNAIFGYVQKGPFVQGTEIAARELDENLNATGRTFTGVIVDNAGSFTVNGDFQSPYVELAAVGFYFNEVAGSLSAAPLNLTALVDLRDGATVNVNVLTHLEKPRVEYLFQSGLTLGQAKAQAQQEILALFNIQNATSENAETLDISQVGEGNAILLAISILLQGDRSEAQLTELLSIISSDIRTDGVLDNSDVQQTLLEAMESMKPRQSAIRDNIVSRYAELGESVTVPPFEDFLFTLDSVPPGIAFSWPEEGDNRNVDAITVRFDELMDHSTITHETVILRNAADDPVAGSLDISDVDDSEAGNVTQVVFVPNAQLVPGVYTLIIGTEVSDYVELGLPSQYALNFTHSSGVTMISGGYRHTCAVTAMGGVQCWGRNSFGQLGDGTTTNRTTPVDVMGLERNVQSVAVTSGSSCVLTGAGGVKCWGNNVAGGLGNGTFEASLTPVDVIGLSSGVQTIAGSYDGSVMCALTDTGGVQCWGSNHEYQLGNGTQEDSPVPVNVQGLSSGVQAIAVGDGHVCALTDAGGVKCWGANWHGQVGRPYDMEPATLQPLIHHPYPVDVVNLSSGVQAIAAGYHHTCALMETGSVQCWGYLANESVPPLQSGITYEPVTIDGFSNNVEAIVAGGYHTCGLLADGFVKCFGENDSGQLGDGTTTNRVTPVYVTGLPENIAAVYRGNRHTCALHPVGGARCWGDNAYGQLGDGTTSQRRTTPVSVMGLSLEVPSAPIPTPPAPTPSPTPTPLPAPGEGDEDMILIPGGPFYMGCDLDDPAHAERGCWCEENSCDLQNFSAPQTVTVESFYIDKYPVTNARYAACVNAGACLGPPEYDPASETREWYYGNPEYDDYPLVNLWYGGAASFCEWAGKRLPTGAEWEKAARGDSDWRMFPWGDELPNAALANYDNTVGDTTAVGSYPDGVSPYGVMDMTGNVWEWVDGHINYPHDPKRELRGGAWNSNRITLALRHYQYGDSMRNTIGFRCGRSVE